MIAVVGTVGLAIFTLGVLVFSGFWGSNPRPDAAIGSRPSVASGAATWSGLSWSEVTFEVPDVGSADVFEQMVAVAGDVTGFVAIGSGSGPEGDAARIWQSDDSITWKLVESRLLDGMALVDVAVFDGTFIAIGSTTGIDPDAYSTSLLLSRDGVAWLEAEAIPGAYAVGVAAGPRGFIAVLSDVEHEDLSEVLLSPDGASWKRMSGADVAAGAQIRDIAWDTIGWLAVGSLGHRAAAWRSDDGTHWTEDPLPGAEPVDGVRDVTAYRVVPGRWATLVLGLDLAPSCAEDDDWCGKYQAAWSRTAESGWARLAESNWLLQRGTGVDAYAAGEAGFLYLFGGDVRTSADGWDWLPLNGSAAPVESGSLDPWPGDLVVLGDRVVGVGTLASAPQLEAWFGSARVIR